ncbi:hypothetical protein DBR42_01180 [Pelomonas sp. HMWF004]|nr:hypothetical protein DBR42_01180 [Pelomonas sp. HMWF004]
MMPDSIPPNTSPTGSVPSQAAAPVSTPAAHWAPASQTHSPEVKVSAVSSVVKDVHSHKGVLTVVEIETVTKVTRYLTDDSWPQFDLVTVRDLIERNKT